MACHYWTVAAIPWLDKGGWGGGGQVAAFLAGHVSLSDSLLHKKPTALTSIGPLKSLPRVTQEGVLCVLSWGGPSPKTRKVHKARKRAGQQWLATRSPLFSTDSLLTTLTHILFPLPVLKLSALPGMSGYPYLNGSPVEEALACKSSNGSPRTLSRLESKLRQALLQARSKPVENTQYPPRDTDVLRYTLYIHT